MSKKNKLRTRQNAHAHALKRATQPGEKEDQEKRAAKASKATQKLQAVQQQSLKKAGSSATAVRLRSSKRKRRGPRLIKGAVVRGIKVTDAESKRKIRAKLAEEFEAKMDLDGDDAGGWQEMTADEVADMQS